MLSTKASGAGPLADALGSYHQSTQRLQLARAGARRLTISGLHLFRRWTGKPTFPWLWGKVNLLHPSLCLQQPGTPHQIRTFQVVPKVWHTWLLMLILREVIAGSLHHPWLPVW